MLITIEVSEDFVCEPMCFYIFQGINRRFIHNSENHKVQMNIGSPTLKTPCTRFIRFTKPDEPGFFSSETHMISGITSTNENCLRVALQTLPESFKAFGIAQPD